MPLGTTKTEIEYSSPIRLESAVYASVSRESKSEANTTRCLIYKSLHLCVTYLSLWTFPTYVKVTRQKHPMLSLIAFSQSKTSAWIKSTDISSFRLPSVVDNLKKKIRCGDFAHLTCPQAQCGLRTFNNYCIISSWKKFLATKVISQQR